MHPILLSERPTAQRTRRVLTFILVLSAILFMILYLQSPQGATSSPVVEADTSEATADPEWLEPRGLSVVDMLRGGVSPSIFNNSVLVWWPGIGLLQYESATVVGNTVTVTAVVEPGSTDKVFCMGQPGFNDNWTVAVPPSTALITSNGSDITNKVTQIQYYRAGKQQPDRGAAEGVVRYDFINNGSATFTGGELDVPANTGCYIYLDGTYSNVKVRYTFDIPQHISVSIIDSTNKDFKSYYWPNTNLVFLTSLNDQLFARYGFAGNGRHDFHKFTPASNVDYVMMVFPPTSIDPYTGNPAKIQKGSGTYRLREAGPPFTKISVDHTALAGHPIKAQTLDVDFLGQFGYNSSTKFLPFWNSTEYRMHALEAGVLNQPYDSCYTNGGCSSAVLEANQNDIMNVNIYYMQISVVDSSGLTQIPIKQPGPGWSPGQDGEAPLISRPPEDVVFVDADFDASFFVYMPFIQIPLQCPCGYFDEHGRMLDVVPPDW